MFPAARSTSTSSLQDKQRKSRSEETQRPSLTVQCCQYAHCVHSATQGLASVSVVKRGDKLARVSHGAGSRRRLMSSIEARRFCEKSSLSSSSSSTVSLNRRVISFAAITRRLVLVHESAVRPSRGVLEATHDIISQPRSNFSITLIDDAESRPRLSSEGRENGNRPEPRRPSFVES